MWRGLLLAVLLAGCAQLAACAQLPPTPQDLRAKKFEAVPGKAVIYLVRDSPDHNDVPAQIWLGDTLTLITYPGTYYRWEVPPGRHRIAGFASDIGSITIDTAPGRIYFVQQRLQPFLRYALSHFQLVGEPEGRAAVTRAVLLVRP